MLFKNSQKGQSLVVNAILLAVVVLVAGLLILCVVAVKGSFDNRVTDGTALSQFRALAGTEDVTIVMKSNDHWFFGDMNDVVYTLSVDGVLAGGRCVSDSFSPVICRLYWVGGE